MKLVGSASAMLELTFTREANIIDSVKHRFVANTRLRKRIYQA